MVRARAAIEIWRKPLQMITNNPRSHYPVTRHTRLEPVWIRDISGSETKYFATEVDIFKRCDGGIWLWDLINLENVMGHFEKLIEDLRREQLARRPVIFVKSLGPNVDALKRRATGILNKAFGDYKAGKITGLELTQIENAVGKLKWPEEKRGRR